MKYSLLNLIFIRSDEQACGSAGWNVGSGLSGASQVRNPTYPKHFIGTNYLELYSLFEQIGWISHYNIPPRRQVSQRDKKNKTRKASLM